MQYNQRNRGFNPRRDQLTVQTNICSRSVLDLMSQVLCIFFSADCLKQNKFVCAKSRQCAESESEVSGSLKLCNDTNVLCINQENVCDGVNNCFATDNSDEDKCA